MADHHSYHLPLDLDPLVSVGRLARAAGQPATGETLADVRFGSKADMATDRLNVRFTPKSGHRPAVLIVSVIAGC